MFQNDLLYGTILRNNGEDSSGKPIEKFHIWSVGTSFKQFLCSKNISNMSRLDIVS